MITRKNGGLDDRLFDPSAMKSSDNKEDIKIFKNSGFDCIVENEKLFLDELIKGENLTDSATKIFIEDILEVEFSPIVRESNINLDTIERHTNDITSIEDNEALKVESPNI